MDWKMASSEIENVDDGRGGLLSMVVYRGAESDGWRWSVGRQGADAYVPPVGIGRGYPCADTARAGAEQWLAAYRAAAPVASDEVAEQ